MIRLLPSALAFALALACTCEIAQAAPAQIPGGAMQRVVSENPPFILFKPSSWKLHQAVGAETMRISVATVDDAAPE
jgi:hypothetical protein